MQAALHVLLSLFWTPVVSFAAKVARGWNTLCDRWSMAMFGKRFHHDNAGQSLLVASLAVVSIIIGAFLAITLTSALFPTFMGSVADINENLSDENVTTGDDTADTFMRFWPVVIGIVAVVFIVGIIFMALEGRGGGGL